MYFHDGVVILFCQLYVFLRQMISPVTGLGSAGWLGNGQLDRAIEKLIINGTGKAFAGLISNPDEFYIMGPSVVKGSMALFSTPKFGARFCKGP